MMIGLILYAALICFIAAMIKVIKPAPSFRLIRCIRFQVECVFDLFAKWVPYLITVVPLLVVLAMAGQSNHIVVSLDILFLFSLLMLVLFQRIKQSNILPA